MATPYYHNELAESERSVSARRQPIRESELELAAFERGRQQGDLEAVRRLEAQGPKTLINHTVVNPVATANVVEIEHLTWLQRGAAIFGELCSVAYIVIMAYWIDQYRGGADWDNSNNNNNAGMFNVHVIASFVGLFAACQAYLMYRVLPLRFPSMLNKAIYVSWQVLALASFAICAAAAIKSQPGTTMQSMHAWTGMLALLVYAVHAVYSTIRVLLSVHRNPVSLHRWNESVNVAEQPTAWHNWHMSAEQRRDHNNQLPTLYRAAPILSKSGHAAQTEYHADGSINAAGGAAPYWSESDAVTADRFFLVPRAKWAVTGLIGLGASVLIGLGEWEVLLAAGLDQWSQNGIANRRGVLSYTSTEARLIGVIGLLTLAALMSICYAAMPPRTVVAKGAFGAVPIQSSNTVVVQQHNGPAAGTRHGSVSLGQPSELPPQPIEAVV